MASLETGLTGIIKSVKPVMKDGVHETWESPKGVEFYKFWVEIGDKKSKKPLLSPDTTPWWAKEGTAVSYTLETLPDGKFNFQDIKKPEGQDAKQAHIKEAYKDKPFVGSFNDPLAIKRYAKTEAQGLIQWLFEIREYDTPNVEVEFENAEFFYNWLIADGVTSKATVMDRAKCMVNAIKHITATKKEKLIYDPEKQTFTKTLEGNGLLNKFIPDTGDKAEDRVTSKLVKLADKFYNEIEKIK